MQVSIFDVAAGSLSITQAHTAAAAAPPTVLCGPVQTIGDGQLKTFTFNAARLLTRTPDSDDPFDFEVRRLHDAAGAPQLARRRAAAARRV